VQDEEEACLVVGVVGEALFAGAVDVPHRERSLD